MKTNAHTYSSKDLTVTYNPSCCINAGLCFRNLSEVFRTTVIPWIDLEGAEKEKIIAQIKKCPSGALKYLLHQKDVA